MSADDRSRSHPYAVLEGSQEWTVLDRAVSELVENRDLVETTAHTYVVGYLCKALATTGRGNSDSGTERRQALNRLREAVRRANPNQRDLVRELIEERRTEARSE
jgi:hypothetical protein